MLSVLTIKQFDEIISKSGIVSSMQFQSGPVVKKVKVAELPDSFFIPYKDLTAKPAKLKLVAVGGLRLAELRSKAAEGAQVSERPTPRAGKHHIDHKIISKPLKLANDFIAKKLSEAEVFSAVPVYGPYSYRSSKTDGLCDVWERSVGVSMRMPPKRNEDILSLATTLVHEFLHGSSVRDYAMSEGKIRISRLGLSLKGGNHKKNYLGVFNSLSEIACSLFEVEFLKEQGASLIISKSQTAIKIKEAIDADRLLELVEKLMPDSEFVYKSKNRMLYLKLDDLCVIKNKRDYASGYSKLVAAVYVMSQEFYPGLDPHQALQELTNVLIKAHYNNDMKFLTRFLKSKVGNPGLQILARIGTSVEDELALALFAATAKLEPDIKEHTRREILEVFKLCRLKSSKNEMSAGFFRFLRTIFNGTAK